MRLFVAVEIDEASRRVAAGVQRQMQAALGGTVAARWVPVANMHLTVRFIGHVEDVCAPAVIEALTEPLEIPRFDVELGACGAFPSRGAPRVLWIGLTQGLASLAQLHHAFDRRLRPFGFAPETRPFSAHLTLARIKDAPRGSVRGLRDAVGGIDIPATRWQVSHATVFQSHLSPKGPRYAAMGRSELKTEKL
jgi:2'-5' RNA ligase